MELKTTEETLKEIIKLTVELDKSDGITSVMIIDDMQRLIKNYALQEVKKHLKIASDLCKIKSDGMAITNIKIDLT